MFYRNHDSLNFFVQNYKTCFTWSIEVIESAEVLHHSNLIYRQFNLSIQECLYLWFWFILSLQSFFPAPKKIPQGGWHFTPQHPDTDRGGWYLHCGFATFKVTDCEAQTHLSAGPLCRLSWVLWQNSVQVYFLRKAQPRGGETNISHILVSKTAKRIDFSDVCINKIPVLCHFSHLQSVCICPLLVDRGLQSSLSRAPLSAHGWRWWWSCSSLAGEFKDEFEWEYADFEHTVSLMNTSHHQWVKWDVRRSPYLHI